MGVIAEAIRHMIAGGMSSEAIVIAVEAMEKASHPQRTARQERNSRYYSKKKEASENRLKASYSDAPPSLDGFNGFLEPSLTSLETLPPIVPPKKSENEIGFEAFWSEYPKLRAGNKDKAFAAYLQARKRGATHDGLFAKAKEYSRSREVSIGMAKGCAAWLNDDRWRQSYTPHSAPASQPKVRKYAEDA